MHWVKPELVAEIEFAGWTGDGNGAPGRLQGPARRQAGRRGRGRNARQRPRRPRSPRPSPRDVKRRPAPSVVMGVTISHPDKPLWPDARGRRSPSSSSRATTRRSATGCCRISRAGHARWSARPTASAASRLLPAPRHARRLVDLITEVKVCGETKPYLQLDRVEALAAVAQIGALELHPWNCQPGEPELPGRLVFDLDPAPDVGFDEVIEGRARGAQAAGEAGPRRPSARPPAARACTS